MTLSLTQLQHNFAQGLKYQAEAEHCDITSDKFNATERLQIYRNNFVISLTEVLQATYPMLLAVLGEECFDAIARYYILSHPLNEGDVSRYGKDFDKTIAAFPNVIEAAPYAEQLASFEWQLDSAHQSFCNEKRKPYQPLSEMKKLLPQQLNRVVIHIYPWVKPFQCQFALFDFYYSFSTQNFGQLNLDKAQVGVISCNEYGQPWATEITANQFNLLNTLINKTALDDIPAQQLEELSALTLLGIFAGYSLDTRTA